MEDVRRYLSDSQRVADQYARRGLAEWVEDTYAKMEPGLYAMFSDDGKSLEANVPLPARTNTYLQQQARFELLRRRFVIAGWVSAAIDRSAELGPHPLLRLAAPHETVIIQTVDGTEFVPELPGFETVDEAVARFTTRGANFYVTPWEHVTIPPHRIARIIRRMPA